MFLALLRIRDVYPRSLFLSIPDLESQFRIQKQQRKRRGKNLLSYVQTKNLSRLAKNFAKLSKIWLRARIWKKSIPIPDPEGTETRIRIRNTDFSLRRSVSLLWHGILGLLYDWSERVLGCCIVESKPRIQDCFCSLAESEVGSCWFPQRFGKLPPIWRWRLISSLFHGGLVFLPRNYHTLVSFSCLWFPGGGGVVRMTKMTGLANWRRVRTSRIDILLLMAWKGTR